ncbi:MAG: sugar transferase [Akkermansia sp.]|nr:sugar transferase [Akkermansia sp.]
MTRHKSILSRLLPLTDLILALCCAYAAPSVTHFLAPYIGWESLPDFNVFTASPFLAGAAVAAVPVILRIVGFYHRSNLQRKSSAIRQLIGFVVYYLGFFGLYQTITPDNTTAAVNHIILVSLVLITVALYLRFQLLQALQLRPRAGRNHLRQVILAGTADSIEKEWNALPDFWKRRLNPVGRVIAGQTTQQEVQQLIEQNHVQQLMLCGGLRAYHDMAETITRCELQGIDIYVHLSNDHPVNLRSVVSEIGEQRVLILTSTPVYSWSTLFKNVFDKVMALLGIIGTSPLWLIAAIGIKISDPNGKIFYRQQRSGLYGKPFGMWKFRSMYADADKRLDEIKAKYGNEMDGPIFKLTNDPRIFRFGHFIRKTSIDELPQLINVLAGDMSLVGPRPLPTYETAEFPNIRQRRRLSVKPGLTCYWQIEDRSDCKDFDSMINKDLKYIDNWNLWTDFVLILRTIPAVLFGKGAK